MAFSPNQLVTIRSRSPYRYFRFGPPDTPGSGHSRSGNGGDRSLLIGMELAVVLLVGRNLHLRTGIARFQPFPGQTDLVILSVVVEPKYPVVEVNSGRVGVEYDFPAGTGDFDPGHGFPFS